MSVRVAINGFGRIGRNFIRALREADTDLDLVAINDLVDIETNATLLRSDSTQGRFKGSVDIGNDGLVIDGKPVKIYAERDPKNLPWKELDIDVVVESTGRFTNRDDAYLHVAAGAKRVVVSAPSKGADATIVMGVNEETFDPNVHMVISNASCTTNCFVPMVKVIDDAFTLRTALMTTVHAMTNDQNLLDLAHSDLRRARAASINIVPTSTGAARATGLVMQAMAGKLDGTSLRVPVIDGSITDMTGIVEKKVSVEEINEAFHKAATESRLSRVLSYSTDPLVSSDIIGNPSSCIFDSPLTMAQDAGGGATLIKIFGWYDNEWGYSNRLVDLVDYVGKKA